jgi:L-seryl-tRNA(Ser) seleniumtransferase
MLGVNIINVKNERELRAALGPRTALVMVLAKTAGRAKTLRLEHIVPIAREQKVPVLVDAAAEDLSMPNVHLTRGADLVAYSGGKAFRGPQSTGLLVGRKDLVQAAWLNSAPHHSFGRPMKVTKEDIMGLLAAVEMWVERDHEAERRTWAGWVDEIAASVGRVPGVEARVMRFEGIMQREPLIGIKWDSKPRLEISWDSKKLGITGDEVYKRLYSEEPRIVLRSASGDGRGSGESSVTVVPMYMQRADANIVARRLYALLSDAAKSKRVAGGSSADVTSNAVSNLVGRWDVRIDFAYGNAGHKLFFEQDGANLTGTHLGERTEGAISGWVDGDRVVFRDTQQYEGGSFQYQFEGSITGDSMQGEVDPGEYGAARWSAQRHA